MKYLIAVIISSISMIPMARAANSPSSQPTALSVAEAKVNRAAQRSHAATTQRAAVESRWRDSLHATPQYRSAVAEMEAKRDALDQARKAGEIHAQMKASGEFIKAKKVVDAMDADAPLEVVKARTDEDSARTELDSARRELELARQAVIDSDPIRIALRAHRLAVGMTLDQANEATGEAGGLVDQDSEGFSTYEWVFYRDSGYANIPPTRTGSLHGVFRAGKLVRFWLE